MATKRLTRRQVEGLVLIAGLGVLQLLAGLVLWHEHVGAFRFQENIIEPLVYFVFLLELSFFSIYWAKSKASRGWFFGFFHDFSFFKGLALILIAPALSFWVQLFRNFHEMSGIMEPFTLLLIQHLVFVFLLGVAAFFLAVSEVYCFLRKRKRKKNRPNFFSFITSGLFNVLLIRFFFKEVCVNGVGKFLAIFVGVAYLIYFYFTAVSVFIPQDMAMTTMGFVSERQEVGFVLLNRHAKNTGKYCIITLENRERYAFKTCPPCAEKGQKVLITHNPLDHLSRHSNKAECLIEDRKNVIN